ncbi:hypothetical protein C0991_011783 [Blastosporella zonata]|nr:hypothetical protein C0991_011783 [Blastosporella zonata]
MNVPAANRTTRVPQEVLLDSVVEEIKTRCCFVGDVLGTSTTEALEIVHTDDDGSEIEVPPSDSTQSESDFSHTGRESMSEFSVISDPPVSSADAPRGENHLQALATMYTRHSTSTDLHMRVVPPPSQQTGTGRGTLIIPGWIRERAAEVLFEGGDVDEASVAEVILNALLKVPVDLRKTLASSILLSGGTAMLPGFIPRLHAEIIRALSPPDATSRHPTRPDRPPQPQYDRYASLRPLIPYLAILNNPSPPPPLSDRAKAHAGKAPAFSPATLSWVGGSLAGSLKTGGAEVSREKWDEANTKHDPDESMDVAADFEDRSASNILPDWTRTPLPAGAPAANVSRILLEIGA